MHFVYLMDYLDSVLDYNNATIGLILDYVGLEKYYRRYR